MPDSSSPGYRLQSLDAFRGLTVAGMLLVNNPGSWSYVYPPLEHAEWNGWTPTDLIFPFFLFSVGISLSFSLARRREAGADRRALLGKIVRRGLLIILVGLLLNGFPRYDLAHMRFPGVLQRIGAVYLVAALLWVLASRRVVAGVTLALLLGYWALMTLVPVPGYGAGHLEPVGNLAQYLDARLFAGHTWKPEWDPEGFLSTLPAIATCLLGAFTGERIRGRAPSAGVVRELLGAGAVLVAAGLAWGIWFPVNKSLWTSSYVVFTAGAALLGLGCCYWLMEVAGRRRWAVPALVFGVNPLVAFVGSGLMARLLVLVKVAGPEGPESLKQQLYRDWFATWLGPLNGSLGFALVFVLVWLGLLWVPWRKGWVVRL